MNNGIKKILVIDDDPHAVEAIGSVLKDSNFEVVSAIDGEEGLDMAKKQKPDLIVLDIIMPKMDGLEALKNLRNDQWGKNVPVLILTNANDNEKLAQALELGVDEYLIKSNTQLNHIAEKAKRILGV